MTFLRPSSAGGFADAFRPLLNFEEPPCLRKIVEFAGKILGKSRNAFGGLNE